MKRKRIIITLSVVAAVLVILFGGIVIRNRLNDYSHILRLNWNLILPSDSGCSEIYSDDSGPSFHGDGIRYHVFNYENETAIDTMVDWQLTEGKTRFRMDYSETVVEWLDILMFRLNSGRSMQNALSGISRSMVETRWLYCGTKIKRNCI